MGTSTLLIKLLETFINCYVAQTTPNNITSFFFLLLLLYFHYYTGDRINGKHSMDKSLTSSNSDTIHNLWDESSNPCVQDRWKYIKVSSLIIAFHISMLFNETCCGFIIKINACFVKFPKIKDSFIHLHFKCLSTAISYFVVHWLASFRW